MPQGFGVIGEDSGARSFNLPGNPSTPTCRSRFFGRPALAALQGTGDLALTRTAGPAGLAARSPNGRARTCDGVLDGARSPRCRQARDISPPWASQRAAHRGPNGQPSSGGDTVDVSVLSVGGLAPSVPCAGSFTLICRGSRGRWLPSWLCCAPALTHLDDAGRAPWWYVSAKAYLCATATASGGCCCPRRPGGPAGGNGAQGRCARRRPYRRDRRCQADARLIPLVHPLAIHGFTVDLTVEDAACPSPASVRHRRPDRGRDGA